VDWIDLVQNKDQWRVLVNTVTKLRDPYNFGKFLNSCTTGGFSRRAQLHAVGQYQHCTASNDKLIDEFGKVV
jgi:hypothetical protein